MTKRLASTLFAFLLILSLASSSQGFNNNKENFSKDPVTSEVNPIPYTPSNIQNGLIKGGHDTLTSEAMKLKTQVHAGDDKFTAFADEALSPLRIGAHDEDTNKFLDFHLNDPPLGPNDWGDFFYHFYDPTQNMGFKGMWHTALDRAKDYQPGRVGTAHQ